MHESAVFPLTMTEMHEKNIRVYLSVGSNMGDKNGNCIKGIDLLDSMDGVSVVSVSSFYRTAPVDYTDQEWFVNAAIGVDTFLKPESLMFTLKQVEQNLGQYEKSVRFGPRIIDLDIILYGDLIFETEKVTLPHPRMHKRCFVLKPLCDIAPDAIHPVFRSTVKALLENIKNDPEQKVEIINGQVDLNFCNV
ncbi:FolK [Desulfamplus magnetovallimortis]|uniref:2-amino-4-hydroxy-6-hydroxymethyldihydropteridine pyrophosphokinase n=1 Tax=Desulfamplus magnetovallimortis TaxID=1246637 RepID=A0A1W1HD27_9BACT|nr:2-amino-4-hydroxy-6-hydroxymethyldihydropteridine diphosphokinase [Desulfamplus magnetovallimortis]SLM30333.1 FolK [Desulfamplus magnetovallimortis]